MPVDQVFAGLADADTGGRVCVSHGLLHTAEDERRPDADADDDRDRNKKSLHVSPSSLPHDHYVPRGGAGQAAVLPRYVGHVRSSRQRPQDPDTNRLQAASRQQPRRRRGVKLPIVNASWIGGSRQTCESWVICQRFPLNGSAAVGRVISAPTDQNPSAQERRPMELILQGWP